MKTTLTLEIFDDGELPVTCARDFRTNNACEFLRASRFGTVFVCKIFSEWKDYLEITDNEMGFIQPHEECLKRRNLEKPGGIE